MIPVIGMATSACFVVCFCVFEAMHLCSQGLAKATALSTAGILAGAWQQIVTIIVMN